MTLTNLHLKSIQINIRSRWSSEEFQFQSVTLSNPHQIQKLSLSLSTSVKFASSSVTTATTTSSLFDPNSSLHFPLLTHFEIILSASQLMSLIRKFSSSFMPALLFCSFDVGNFQDLINIDLSFFPRLQEARFSSSSAKFSISSNSNLLKLFVPYRSSVSHFRSLTSLEIQQMSYSSQISMEDLPSLTSLGCSTYYYPMHIRAFNLGHNFPFHRMQKLELPVALNSSDGFSSSSFFTHFNPSSLFNLQTLILHVFHTTSSEDPTSRSVHTQKFSTLSPFFYSLSSLSSLKNLELRAKSDEYPEKLLVIEKKSSSSSSSLSSSSSSSSLSSSSSSSSSTSSSLCSFPHLLSLRLHDISFTPSLSSFFSFPLLKTLSIELKLSSLEKPEPNYLVIDSFPCLQQLSLNITCSTYLWYNDPRKPSLIHIGFYSLPSLSRFTFYSRSFQICYYFLDSVFENQFSQSLKKKENHSFPPKIKNLLEDIVLTRQKTSPQAQAHLLQSLFNSLISNKRITRSLFKTK